MVDDVANDAHACLAVSATLDQLDEGSTPTTVDVALAHDASLQLGYRFDEPSDSCEKKKKHL